MSRGCSRTILAIETSCDETSAAVLSGAGDDARLLSCVILSQDVHRVYRGIVPELASRAHLAAVGPVVDRALGDAGAALGDLDLLAVTAGPGLVGALLVGVSYAKGLALATGTPLVGVHHLEAHLFGTALDHPDAVPPFIGLIVSGGHTLLIDVPRWGRYRLLGETRDDAVGEAFDKVGALLGLGFPGGPAIEREAALGDPTRFRFPRPMVHGGQQPSDADWLDLSMSGLKTAVVHAVKGLQPEDVAAERANLARGFQDAVIEVLVTKVSRALDATRRPRVVLGGGVACNMALRAALARELDPIAVHAPSPRIATDNAAMIARAALFHADEAGAPVDADSRLPFPGLVRA